ncbi:MAG: ABC transporter ATP-binding protein, partial [Rhodobiaceae bacterium]|nr:ABC transporter ATP-binding protein [Rhodobiaceae bacterium]
MAAPALQITDVAKSYVDAGKRLDVLKNANLVIQPGEMVALVGPSGAGKSTLLHIAGLLDTPDSGTVHIGGLSGLDGGERLRTRLRRHAIGFVYQFHYLLPEFSAHENVVIPQRIAGLSLATARERASELLALVGLSGRETHRPSQLSGGEQQRVAIARALANAPYLLLADEPT